MQNMYHICAYTRVSHILYIRLSIHCEFYEARFSVVFLSMFLIKSRITTQKFRFFALYRGNVKRCVFKMIVYCHICLTDFELEKSIQTVIKLFIFINVELLSSAKVWLSIFKCHHIHFITFLQCIYMRCDSFKLDSRTSSNAIIQIYYLKTIVEFITFNDFEITLHE